MRIGKNASGTVSVLSGENAEYKDGLLILKDDPSDTVNVTVNKKWNTSSLREDVTLELLANGSASLAAQLVKSAGAGASTVELTVANAANHNWTKTWENLPVYANGEEVTWTVRETKIGDENAQSAGGVYTFATWNSPGYTSRTNGDEVTLTVTNALKNPSLTIHKTDATGNLDLAGARFRLFQSDGTTAIATLTTDENGDLTFGNLSYDTTYILREMAAPEGYEILAGDIKLTIAETGVVKITDGGKENVAYVTGSNENVVEIRNQGEIVLPETGGAGTDVYTRAGALLMMAAALGLAVYKNLRGKEERPG